MMDLRQLRIYLSRRLRLASGCAALFLSSFPVAIGAQQKLAGPQQGWVVRPEWVRAHEEFLASDALAGRGSATRDEEIAAQYVASEFMAYGLQPAPGISGMMQSAEIVAPELDGRSSLTAGAVTLAEGSDYRLLFSVGVGANGPLVRLQASEAKQARVAKGAVVLLTDASGHANLLMLAYSLRGSGAGLVIFEEDDAVRALLAKNPKTRVAMRLKDEASAATALPAAIASASKEAIERLERLQEPTAATLTVHPLPSRSRKTFNAIGYLPGTEAASGTILLSAHLDHLGAISAPVNGDTLFNGANDDASGTTAVLELAHALAAGSRMRRGVLFVCYGSEEVGGLGSQFFGRHSPVPLVQIAANIEFEMVGAQDPKMPKGTLLLTGWERSNLGPMLRDHGALLGPDPYPEQHFFQRSDNYSLALEGVVAQTAAGWGTVPTYHQLNDDLAHLDFAFLTAAIQSFVEPIRWLAGSDFKPEWVAGGQPKR